jgi:hypothetical protein
MPKHAIVLPPENEIVDYPLFFVNIVGVKGVNAPMLQI